MRFSKNALRKIIFEEMQQYLDEGRKEKNWIAHQPEEEQEQWLSAEQQGLKLSDLAWIKKVRGGEPIQDIIGDVLYFRKQDVQKKLKDNGFETNLSKKTYPTVNDLRRLIKNVSDAQESDVKYDEIIKDPSQVELLGKVGNWEILFPLTQRGSISCDISGEDTTWCTTKSQGQNLFYSYVGRKGEDLTLFYLMDYTRTPQMKKNKNGQVVCVKDCDSRLSIGWDINGKRIDGEDGGISVNAGNKGLIMNPKNNPPDQSLIAIFGADTWRQINRIMKDKWESIDKGASHPAKEMIKKAAQNVFLLKKIIKDYGEEEKSDFHRQILKQDRISSEVFVVIAKDESEHVRDTVAENPNTPPEVLALLAKDESEHVRDTVAGNPNTPLEVLITLAREEAYIMKYIVKSPNTPPEALATLAREEDWDTRAEVAKNPSTPLETLIILARDEDYLVRREVAGNPNTPQEVIIDLAKDENEYVSRKALAQIQESKLKISKSQLKQIILEEVLKTLNK